MENRPELSDSEIPYWAAFNLLCKGRTSGFESPNPLSLTEILAFFNLRGIETAEEREDYLFLIYELDDDYLSYVAEKAKESREQS